MAQPTDRVKSLYTEMYDEGQARLWRDAGATDKASDIVRLWNEAGLSQNPIVIEIGCGEGAVADALARSAFFASYTGFELSRTGIEECKGRQIPGANFELISGDKIPVADNSADVAILSHVVEHLEHPRQLIYEAARIAPMVIIEVPLELTLRMPRDYVWDELGHINKYTSTSIRQLVQTCGLQVIRQFTMNPSRQVGTFHNDSRKSVAKWYLREYALRVAPGAARTFMTYHEALLAKRASG